MDVRSEVADALGRAVRDIEPIGGGCVSAVYLVRLADGTRIVAKADEKGLASLPVEGFMLSYLAKHTPLPVPDVLFTSDRLLLLQFMPGESRFSREAERQAAGLVAALHAIKAPKFGFERDTLIGGLRQPNPPTSTWKEFFREHRLLHMAGKALSEGRLTSATYGRIERMAAALDRWILEPQFPQLVHGDIWTTNVLAVGDRITAFLDPAIYFGHAEIELAFITLFNTFGRDFFSAYQEVHQIAPGFFEERRDIYNLYPLLVHVRLFGGSYVSTVERTLDRFEY